MAESCFHCGLPVPPGSRHSVRIEGMERAMCCAGCAAVATLIADSGLAAYYRHREAPAAAPAEPSAAPDEYRIFDTPEASSAFVAALPGGLAQAQLAIDGIRCAACTWLLERNLGALPAVRGISVSLAEGRAALRWDPAVTPLSALMARIRSLGYAPRPWIPAAREAGLAAENTALLRRLGVAGIVQMQIGMLALALYAGAFDGIEDRWRDMLRWGSLVLCLPVVFYSSTPFFAGAWRGLRHLRPGMDVPIAAAIALAFAASAWYTLTGGGEVWYDSVSMFAFFLLLGRWLELRARRLAGLAGGSLLALLPASARRQRADGGGETVPVERLQPGDRVLVRTGEAVPADGIVRDGNGSVDESGLSGESLPLARAPGDRVHAGTLCVTGTLELEVEATGLRTRLGSILALADRAQMDKPRSMQLADRGATAFVLVVLALALLSGLWWLRHDASRAVEIVLAVLVVSCPCALALATPVAHTAALTWLRRRGFLVTRAHALDALADASLALLDKTGTLTTATPALEAVHVAGPHERDACLRAAASLEARSLHPLAAAFAGIPAGYVEDFREVPGAGLEGRTGGALLRLGRPEFALPGTARPLDPGPGTWILLADETAPRAWFRITDSLRTDARDAVDALRSLGLRVRVLSGDAEAEVARVAGALDVDGWESGCTPERKLAAVREAERSGEHVLVAGDGVNDVAVLAGAGLSIAVAGAADVSRATADCMILSGGLARIPQAIACARRTRNVVRQNLAWAAIYNLAAIPFAAAGLVPPWLAAIGMSASSLLVVANALRLRKDAPVHRTT